MLIGQLSRACGLSRDTIRFYEKKRLISLGRKDRQSNNYKEYSDETLQRLLSIKRLKGFEFTLDEVLSLLGMLDAHTATCKNVSHKIDEKLLLFARKQLLDGKRGCENEVGALRTPNATCPVFI